MAAIAAMAVVAIPTTIAITAAVAAVAAVVISNSIDGNSGEMAATAASDSSCSSDSDGKMTTTAAITNNISCANDDYQSMNISPENPTVKQCFRETVIKGIICVLMSNINTSIRKLCK